MSDAVFYVVATPIGNLGDLTPRAVDVLQSVALIAAEDTRHSGRLMAHFNIKTPMISVHDHNERQRLQTILDKTTKDQFGYFLAPGFPTSNIEGLKLG